MKPFISYLKSVIRAVICGLVYLAWFNLSREPSALAAGNAAATPFSYYAITPFASCVCLMLTITFFHHIMTVPLNWIAAWFPKWVSRDFNSRKRWYWPAWDSWREGINAALISLIGIVLCGFIWVVSILQYYEKLTDPDKLNFVLGLLVIFNGDLVNAFANLLGQDLSGEIQTAREMAAPALTSDFQRLRIIWLIIATLLYQYLRRDPQHHTAPKSKGKAKKKTQAQIEVDPIEQELNQLSADMGTIKMKSVRKPKTQPKP